MGIASIARRPFGCFLTIWDSNGWGNVLAALSLQLPFHSWMPSAVNAPPW